MNNDNIAYAIQALAQAVHQHGYSSTPVKTLTREEVWLRAWCSVASANNTTEKAVHTVWADECLKNYDKKF